MASFDENAFAGDWWEIARYRSSQPLELTTPDSNLLTTLHSANAWDSVQQIGPSTGRTGLASIDFTGMRVKWEFLRQNIGFYGLKLTVYDPISRGINKTVSGFATLRDNVSLNIILDDNACPKEIGTYNIIYTDYTDLAVIGKPNTELVVFSRRFSITPSDVKRILILAQRADYDASRLLISHNSVVNSHKMDAGFPVVRQETRSAQLTSTAPPSGIAIAPPITTSTTPHTQSSVPSIASSTNPVISTSKTPHTPSFAPIIPSSASSSHPVISSIPAPRTQSVGVGQSLAAIAPLSGQVLSTLAPNSSNLLTAFGPNIGQALSPISQSAPSVLGAFSTGAATPFVSPAYKRNMNM